ncbi:hypothetical protein FOA43_000457 [Brettanomyces nanus]|uniref:Multifunctional fusion protein n=1 Tax=Eeniella nana TaxID=13502 RepID=A0A875RVU4_EENNA|nr:uncharacterized protein FOA43_000457 [Brettanomyces nanus]QPG73151.1 hypothetical protein FOA43_000457 [Brettanomyces nanus]
MSDEAQLVSFSSLVVSKPQNHGGLPKFKQLVDDLFLPVERITRNLQLGISLKKADVIERFIRNYRQTVGNDILPVAHLFFPKWDRDRVYMMKEYRLGHLVCQYLNLGKNSDDYKTIANWKRLSYNRVHATVKFSDLLVKVILERRVRPVIKDSLGVDDINDMLDKLQGFAQDSKLDQMKLIKEAIDRLTDSELRFFFRIVLKTDPIGSESVFLRCWHRDAKKLYDLTHDLKLVFWGLSDPNFQLSDKEKEIQLMLPFTPQRCQRVRDQYVKIPSENFNDGPFFIEEKFDGERIQVHIKRVDGERFQFKYYTRNAMDYTSIYGEFSTSLRGCLSPFLGPENFDLHMHSCILDGEMICYDPILKVPLPYSVLKTSALHSLSAKPGSKNPHPMFVAFDCVFVNGESLEKYPLERRKKVLSYVLKKPIANLFVAADFIVARTGDEIEKAMDRAIGMDSEGLVLKSIQSKYDIGATTKQWIKIKPEYLEEFGENLDLVVVGKIPGIKSSFLCGLRDDNDSGCKFMTLCKISNGFSQDDYRHIDRVTAGKWKDINMDPPNDNLVKFGKTLPVVWIDPRDSVVIEARARSITRQPEQEFYATDTTLYNAFCVKIRTDKDWKTASTLKEYEQSSNQSKLYNAQNVIGNESKKRRIGYPSKKITMLQKLNEEYEVGGLAPKSNLFESYIFSIRTDCIYLGKLVRIRELNQIVSDNGGALARNPESVVLDTDKHERLMVIAEKMTIEVKDLSNKYNVFRFKWCEDCLAVKELIEPDLTHILVAEPSLEEDCRKRLDKFGNNLVTPLTEYTLWKMVPSEERNEVNLSQEELNRYHSFFVFYKMKFKVIFSAENARIGSIVAQEIEINGGKVCESLEEASMIVVVLFKVDKQNSFESYSSTTAIVQRTMRQRNELRKLCKRIPRVVSHSYIRACTTSSSLVDPAEYKRAQFADLEACEQIEKLGKDGCLVIPPIIKASVVDDTDVPGNVSTLKIARNEKYAIEFTKDEPVMETLGNPKSTLSLTIPPSVPVYVKRGSLISIFMADSGANLDTAVTSTLRINQPIRRFLYGGFTSTYQRLLSTVSLNLMISAYSKGGPLSSFMFSTKAQSTKTFCNIAMDGTMDWALLDPKSLHVYTGNNLLVTSQMLPKKTNGKKKLDTGLYSLFQSGYTLLTGRGYVSLVGSGSIFKLGLARDEEIYIKQANLLATTIKDVSELSSGYFIGKNIDNKTFAKSVKVKAKKEVGLGELETTKSRLSWFGAFKSMLVKVLSILASSQARVSKLVAFNGRYIKVKGPRTLLIQTSSGLDKFVYNSTLLGRSKFRGSITDVEKFIRNKQQLSKPETEIHK